MTFKNVRLAKIDDVYSSVNDVDFTRLVQSESFGKI